MEMKNILNRMLNHEELTREETKNIILGITQSEFPEEQITALLTGLQMRGVTVDELLGFRDGILETGVPAILNCDRYIDVVGTGGDRKNTFNISTTSCFVIAGAGYKVAKHGNFAATSVSGASNVIKNHGVQFTDDLDKLNRSLDEAGIVYLHAQLFAKAMKFVGPIRKALQFPTVFNLLGPLVNPSQPKCQLLGVANLDQMRLYNQVYQKIGIDYGIVNSIDGYDEISLTSDFKVTTNNYERIFKPQDLGFGIAKPEEVRGGATEQEAKDIFDAVLENRALPAQKNIVLANAAFDTVMKIGWPEARIALAEAVVYLATSPKSNSAYLGINAALAKVRETGNLPVPLHIRNAPTKLMAELGYHDGYKYPHDYPGHFTPQQYLPNEIQSERFWHGQHSPAEDKLYNWMVTCWGDRFKE